MKSESKNLLQELLLKYRKAEKPIEVDFRKLVNLPYHERATHFVHPYPAKLLFHIPNFFLSNDVLSKPGDIVLDPFCGTGTVLLESMLADRKAIGFDINPLACLIARVKTKRLDVKKLNSSVADLKRNLNCKSKLAAVKRNSKVAYWFYPRVFKELAGIRACIETVKDLDIRNFLLVSFSGFIRRVSLADPRISVPVKFNFKAMSKDNGLRIEEEKRINNLKRGDVKSIYLKTLDTNIKRLIELNKFGQNDATVEIFQSDFSKQKKVSCSPAVSLVITSPPYAGAQKYIRASKLSLDLLGFCSPDEIREIEDNSIGREFYPKAEYKEMLPTDIASADRFLKEIRKINPLRAHIAAKYLNDMRDSFRNIFASLKPKGHLVIVIGDNSICGKRFLSHRYLEIIAREIGFKTILKLVDSIQSRGLMTKRNATAGIITKEWVLVFRK
ncbi:MAG: DNA methyltransferase [Elusimicrobiales bacterium]|nr:DNA methyltransferase [Elusimicrobiales bacterium]